MNTDRLPGGQCCLLSLRFPFLCALREHALAPISLCACGLHGCRFNQIRACTEHVQAPGHQLPNGRTALYRSYLLSDAGVMTSVKCTGGDEHYAVVQQGFDGWILVFVRGPGDVCQDTEGCLTCRCWEYLVRAKERVWEAEDSLEGRPGAGTGAELGSDIWLHCQPCSLPGPVMWANLACLPEI